ncbi:3-hydroxyisobutyryl-CoA hydrolase [compost metagenome]
MLQGLVQLNWREQAGSQLHSLLQTLEEEALSQLPSAQLLPRRERIDRLLDVADLPAAWQALGALQDDSDPLLARAAATLRSGCPLTAHLIWEQLRRAPYLSLAEVFRMEYTMSLNCCRHPEFAEGVRARLIDKDNRPSWHWPQLEDVPDAAIAAHFTPTWEGEHPLADLHDH